MIYALNAEATKKENASFEKFMESKGDNKEQGETAVRMWNFLIQKFIFVKKSQIKIVLYHIYQMNS